MQHKQKNNHEHHGGTTASMEGMNRSTMENHTGHKEMDQGNSGHAEHMGHMEHMTDLKRKFFVCLILTVPVLLFSPMMGIQLPFQFTFPGSEWVVLGLSTILFFYGGMPFFMGAKQELKERSPAMMTLITLGISASYIYSLYAFVMNTFFHGPHLMDFFWELATLIVIMLLGHWIEMKAVAGAGDALKKMAELLPAQASVLQPDGSYAVIPLRDLSVGQTVLIKAGEKVPSDGTVLNGSSSINESMVTGEAREVPKKAGDKVIGGSLNGSGSLTITVTGTGESGYLARVMQLVGSARQEKSRAETMSDRVARWLFYVAVGAGLASLIIWYAVTRDISTSITRMVTVLVIACPHALGLAIPLVVARSTSLGARSGLLIRNRKALETAPKVNVVLMDKTGTLTEGNFRVSAVRSFDRKLGENDIVSAAAALETASSHPLAASIMKEAAERQLKPAAAKDVKVLAGEGLTGCLEDGREAAIVSAAYLDKHSIPYSKSEYAELSGNGYSVSFLLLDGKPAGLIAQGDEIKAGAKPLLEGLAARHIIPVMLTGDNQAAAEKTAGLLGLKDYRADMLPENKETAVREYHEQGKVTMMVGDGINDAPSLARADVGVAIGAGTDIAVNSADVVLVKSDPEDILAFLTLAKKTTRKMVQNLWWGAGYNIIAIPLAAGVLAPVGFILSPAAGAVLMSLSTIIVAVNAILLKVK
ncbi:copper-translocating P-type ATPase [Brucepastera parasyntrophica]|uniref:heavy metal translocating P-type ATPase n=1 Tax=Brucepastera parasyntrophica TaxID=2880008 RepID=UPI002108F1D9|nr:heavy metal translocating P-type ATPase [Brucepastera parasyntrophica]ULQ59276.1 copper-translocating P-type ATPase [Brucepastera parasyntrophica]